MLHLIGFSLAGRERPANATTRTCGWPRRRDDVCDKRTKNIILCLNYLPHCHMPFLGISSLNWFTMPNKTSQLFCHSWIRIRDTIFPPHNKWKSGDADSHRRASIVIASRKTTLGRKGQDDEDVEDNTSLIRVCDLWTFTKQFLPSIMNRFQLFVHPHLISEASMPHTI